MTGAARSPYPVRIFDDRPLPAGYDGRVFVWDIDKTYLATRFSSLRGLARIPLEFAIDKAAIPGMPEVLRGLRRGPGDGFAATPLWFVSASPAQLRGVIARKMLLDGVQPDGFVFKDWTATLRALRPARLADQLGFKLCALLTTRALRPLATEALFGDDVERDAEAYTLYADLLAGRAGPPELDAALRAARVPADDRARAQFVLAARPAARGRVDRIFIHLERGTPPERLARFGERLVPVRDAQQLALACHAHELVDEGAVREALTAVEAARGAERVRDDVADALERRLTTADAVQRLELAAAAPPPPGGDDPMTLRLEHHTRDLGRVHLHTAEAGPPDGPLVLLLHGFPETWRSWRHQLPALAAAGFRVVAPDQRGYGESERPAGARAYRLDEVAADVAALIERLGAARAHVVGHDWGAAAAWWTAMHHPERVDRLAILNVPHPRRFAAGLLGRQLLRSWYILFFQLPWLPERLLARADFALLRRLYRASAVRPDAFTAHDVDAYVAAFRAPGALTAALGWYRALLRANPLDLLRRIRPIAAPTLVVWGEQDTALCAELATPDPLDVPQARVVFLPDAGHFVQADAPERVNALLLEFLGERPPIGRPR
jgi:pimeloyl-ACP methyl ester carboxylesterase